MSKRKPARWFVWMFVVMMAIPAAGQPTSKWRILTPPGFDLKDPKVKKKYDQIAQLHKDVLTGKAQLGANAKDFDSYYSLTFKLMSDYNQPAYLQRVQRELLKEIATAPADVRARVLQATGKAMAGLAEPKTNCHPSVRYAALLILGELNDREEVTSGQPSPAVPSAAAYKILLKHFDDPKQLEAPRLAALIGLQRHAQLHAQKAFMDEAKQNELRSRMIALLSQQEPPEGRSTDGHHWMQRRAADVLGALGFQGEGGAKSVQALLQVAANESMKTDVRCAAAAALGMAPLPASVDPVAAAKQVRDLAYTACADQLKIAAKQVAKTPSMSGGMSGGGMEGGRMPGMMPGGMPGMGVGGIGPGPGAMGPGAMGRMGGPMAGGAMGMGGYIEEADPRIDRMRRRLRYQLTCVQYALTGSGKTGGLVAIAKQEAQKSEVTTVVDALAAITKVIDDESEDFLKLINEVNRALVDLKPSGDSVASN